MVARLNLKELTEGHLNHYFGPGNQQNRTEGQLGALVFNCQR